MINNINRRNIVSVNITAHISLLQFIYSTLCSMNLMPDCSHKCNSQRFQLEINIQLEHHIKNKNTEDNDIYVSFFH